MKFFDGSYFCLFLVIVAIGCGGSKVAAKNDSSINAADSVPAISEVEMRDPGKLVGLQVENKTDDVSSQVAFTRPARCGFGGTLPHDTINVNDSNILHSIGQESIMAKRSAQAVALLEKANMISPQDSNIMGDLATALLQGDCKVQAVEWAEKAVSIADRDVDLMANLAQTYQIVGRVGDAIRTYRKALLIAPDDAAVRNNLAVLLVARGDLAGAEKEARGAIRLRPKEPTYLINLGYVLYRQKRFADAEMILVRALSFDANSAAVHNQLGLVFAAQNFKEKAIEEFRQALKIDPDNMAAKENLHAFDEGFDITGPWSK